MEVQYPRDGVPNLPNFNLNRWTVPVVLLLFAVSAAGTVFYQVGPDEEGVVQRFGKYVRTSEPGLRLKLPFGIETVKKIKVTHVYKMEFGFRTHVQGGRTMYAYDESPVRTTRTSNRRLGTSNPYAEESLMLTGDLNVGVVEWSVQYKIKDAIQYAFRVRDPEETIRNMSEAAMRLVVGDHTINAVLTSGRELIQAEVHKMLQEVLDSYGSGISIRNVILQDVTPPEKVKPSFNEVNEARQEKEKVINQAWEEYNRVIPRARGQAEQVIRNAEGYATERINRAKGEAERFLLTWEAYQAAPEVTRRRLYLEMAEKVFPNFEDKLLLDDTQESILPLLHLNREKGGTAS